MDNRYILYKIFKTVLACTNSFILEIFDDDNFNVTSKLNASCFDDSHCKTTDMYCNSTEKICMCSDHYFWNDTAERCQFERKSLINLFIQHNITDDISYDMKSVPHKMLKINIHWSIQIVLIIGALCFMLCTIYGCYEKKKVDENKTVLAALFKQHQQTHRIQTSFIENI